MKTKEHEPKYIGNPTTTVFRAETDSPRGKKRRSSERTRFKNCLDAIQKAGMEPRSVYFHESGGFEVKFTEDQNPETDEFEIWLKDEMEGTR